MKLTYEEESLIRDNGWAYTVRTSKNGESKKVVISLFPHRYPQPGSTAPVVLANRGEPAHKEVEGEDDWAAWQNALAFIRSNAPVRQVAPDINSLAAENAMLKSQLAEIEFRLAALGSAKSSTSEGSGKPPDPNVVAGEGQAKKNK